MRARKRLSLLVAIMLSLQLLLPTWGNVEEIYAASTGPVVVSLSPADNASNVPTSPIFKATFDENIEIADSTKTVTIFQSSTNTAFVSYQMNNSRVSVSNNVLTINANNANLPLDTDFYILIEAGAIKNKSNDALYTGMLNASDWNFRTIDVVDTIRPTVSSVGNGICNTSGTCNSTVPINGSLQFVFSEPVYVSSGDITISSNTDNRTIPVTSSQVQGSGSNTITITPSTVLTPSTTYTIRFSATNFSDASNNFFVGGTWKFTTESGPIQLVTKSPVSGALNVPANSNPTLTFDQNVQGNSSKYITIRKVSNNEVVFNRPATTPYISISGATVTINASANLTNSTSYYITMDSGAITKAGDSNAIFYGIPNATDWVFTTSAAVDNTKPTIKTYSPEINSKTVATNDKLVLTFSEPVFPNNGTIEIYEYNSNALYRSINVTSNRVTGGGTEVITIDPHSVRAGESAKAYSLNTKYYVKISSSAFKDAAGNTFNGVSNKNYYYQVATNAGNGPYIQSLSPINGTTTVATNPTFKATFDKTVVIDYNNYDVRFIPVATQGNIPEVSGVVVVDSKDSKTIQILPSTSLRANTDYYINISDTSIMDSNGNYFVGIMNQYQWTFKTIGGDTTAPIINKAEVSGDTIRLVYNELLIESLKPSPASFYVTVGGSAKNISSISVEGNVVFVKLSSSVSSSQKVTVSYTKPSTGLIQDLSGNQAQGFANLAVSNGFTEDSPTISSSSYSGSTITLNFNTNLNSIHKLAYTQFSVTVNNSTYTINNVTGSGNSLTLTLNQSIPSKATVVVNYSSGLYPMKSTAGTTVNSFSHTVGTSTGTSSGSVSGAPKIKSITLTGNTLYLKYNETIRATSKPGTFQYSILVNNRLVNVTAVSISDDTVVLTLASKPSSSDNITVTYVATSSSILDTDYNAAESFKNMAVGNSTSEDDDGQAVTLQGAILKGNTLTLNFSGKLDQYSIPSETSFLVRIGDNTRVINSVNVSGSQVIIKLSTAAKVGETANISYFNQNNALKSAGGVVVSGFTNMSVANQTTLLDTLSDDFDSAINGVLIKTSASSKSSDTSPGGRSANRYTITTDKLTTAINTLASSNMTNANLVFEVPSTENAAIVAYSVLALDAAKKKGNYTLVINYGDLTYSVPLSSLDLTKAARQSGGNAVSNYIKIAFEEGNTSATSSLTTAINRSDATIIGSPFAYEVSVINGSQSEDAVITGDITSTVKTNSSINKGSTSVVFYDTAVSAISYAPTTFSSSSSETTITFKRPGDGAYAIVRNSKSFSDLSSHWANNEISIMARKFIVEGHSSTKFNPSTNITRGEFATYIVKGLGLSANPDGAKHFTDVNTNTMMGGYIGAAVSAGIVAGVSEKSFAPNSYITRQDMAIMMIRAANYAGLSTTMSSSADSVLSGYTDRGQVSSYAKTGLAKAVNIGIIGGTTTTQLSPKKNATRAEGTLMIMRLLKKVNALQY